MFLSFDNKSFSSLFPGGPFPMLFQGVSILKAFKFRNLKEEKKAVICLDKISIQILLHILQIKFKGYPPSWRFQITA